MHLGVINNCSYLPKTNWFILTAYREIDYEESNAEHLFQSDAIFITKISNIFVSEGGTA